MSLDTFQRRNNNQQHLTNEMTRHTTSLTPSNEEVKDFEKTRKNRTRSNFIVNIQQADWLPVKGVKTVAILKERVIMPRR